MGIPTPSLLDIENNIFGIEHYSGGSSEKLPDTLDIGDVPESGVPRELPSQKLKDLGIDAGASSSGISG